MSLKLKIRLSIFLLLLLLLGLGGYAFFVIYYLEHGAHGIEKADFQAARSTVLGFLAAGTVVGITMMVRLPRIVVRPLHRLSDDVDRVAGPGPATRVAVGKHDEVGTVATAVNRVLSQAQEERRATLAQLFTERNRMESLVRSLDEGLLLLDEQNVIILANPVACDLLGMRQSDLLGRPAQVIAQANPLMGELLEPLAAANLAGDAEPDPVFTFPHKGESPHYQLSISPIEAFGRPGAAPTVGGHIFCLRNVSDFKKLDELKSTFLATISHELKTPLASIKLSLMLLKDERTDAAERQRLATGISEETQRLLNMVGQAHRRGPARRGRRHQAQRAAHEAGRRHLLRHPNRASPAPRQAASARNPGARIPARSARRCGKNHLGAHQPALQCHPLLARGGALTIRAVHWGEMVRVSVEDCGPGIDPEHHKQIFQRFAAVPGHTEQGSGSGLGLSISREFIDAQGGALWVESQPEKGSRFLFTLPSVG
ncbi:ATP-binding protein [Hymenobacter humi]|uniref:histidine kinase n=1 Tax=Hymenobacter humi TaxID=1411620 RepID=A0ABW2U7U3_9BACT